MAPWPIEEVVLRPVLALLVSAALPFGTRAIARRLSSREPESARGAGAVLDLAHVFFAASAGVTALGPSVVERPYSVAAIAFAALAVGTTGVASAFAGRRDGERPALGLRRALSAGSALGAGALPWLLLEEGWLRGAALATGVVVGAVLALAGCTGSSVGAEGVLRPAARDGYVVGSLLAALIGALMLGAWSATRIELDRVVEAGEEASRWRLRVDPWDATAMLAAGWGARARSADRRAQEWADEARRGGAPEAAVLELEAELRAARGDCEAARATFDRALAARAQAAFSDPLASPLPLGGFRLPPTLTTACGGLGRARPDR